VTLGKTFDTLNSTSGRQGRRLLKGLDGTQRGGVRYPIPVAVRGTVTMPKHYQDLLKLLGAADPGGDKPR
jgi:hypothetical protein